MQISRVQFHQMENPLEALVNLVYLTKREVADPDKVRFYMELAESQLQKLTDVTRGIARGK